MYAGIRTLNHTLLPLCHTRDSFVLPRESTFRFYFLLFYYFWDFLKCFDIFTLSRFHFWWKNLLLLGLRWKLPSKLSAPYLFLSRSASLFCLPRHIYNCLFSVQVILPFPPFTFFYLYLQIGTSICHILHFFLSFHFSFFLLSIRFWLFFFQYSFRLFVQRTSRNGIRFYRKKCPKLFGFSLMI